MFGRECIEAHIEPAPKGEELPDQAAQSRFIPGITIDEVLQYVQIIGTDQHPADGGFAVASGPTDLLGVVLQALEQVIEKGERVLKCRCTVAVPTRNTRLKKYCFKICPQPPI